MESWTPPLESPDPTIEVRHHSCPERSRNSDRTDNLNQLEAAAWLDILANADE